MKYIIILGDGMADNPVKELNNKTPLMAANKPAIDSIAKYGRSGRLQTIPEDMPTGSAVANLSVMGYDPKETFRGRGVLEAASIGVELSDTDMAMRVNLICIEDEKIRSHSAGHISDEEASVLINDLKEHFSNININLHQGLSYRHLLVVPGGNDNLKCFPPHDHVGEKFQDLLIKAENPGAQETAKLLNNIIIESKKFLDSHPVNEKRKVQGKELANMLWPWSPGKKPILKTFQERFGLKGAVISAVDLIKGIGIYAGMDVIEVEGATGLFDTNYEGKADACLNTLNDHDFVFVHVESADEAGHSKDLQLKIHCIEDLSQRLIQRIMDGLKEKNMEAVIAILPDHPTPVECGCHTRDAVPVSIFDPRVDPDNVEIFDEESCKDGSLGLLVGSQFIEQVLQ
jgi:2,3-bisphosphoglycerate-independent phosphoglycerate mutase